MKVFRLSALAVVAALGCAGAVYAQQPPAPPPAADHPHWNPEAMRQHMEARRAERMKALHDALNIRPDQESAFAAFAAAMAPPAGDDDMGPHDEADKQAMANLTTPERVDRMMQRLDERMARVRERLQRRADAVKALYAVLSPEQQHTLDALPLLIGQDHGGMGGGHWRGHGPPGMDGGPHGME